MKNRYEILTMPKFLIGIYARETYNFDNLKLDNNYLHTKFLTLTM